MIRSIFSGLLALVSLSGVNAADSPSEFIIFTTLRPTNLEVFLYDSPEAQPERLTNHPALDYGAVLSPDGSWVVFTSERTGNAELFALELATRRLHQLTNHPSMDDAADFSPDGSRVVFVSTRNGFADIYSMAFRPGNKALGANEAIRLTQSVSGNFSPVYAPDGKTIAFSSVSMGLDSQSSDVYERTVGSAIYLMKPDGTDLQRILSTSFPVLTFGSPSWSADGNRLFFCNVSFGGSVKILSLKRDVGIEGPEELAPGIENCYGVVPGSEGHALLNCLRFKDAASERMVVRFETASTHVYISSGQVGNHRELESPGPEFMATDFSPDGKVLAHASIPSENGPTLQNGTLATHPGTERRIQVEGRELFLRGTSIRFPSVSPVTRKLIGTQWIFPTAENGFSPITLANLDGTESRPIFADANGEFLWSPVVSRDGEWVFFTKGEPFSDKTGELNIWKVRIDGTGATNLTPSKGSNDALPDVSADGSRIVFRRKDSHGSHIYVMNSDGSNPRRVTDGPGVQTMPSISPDGSFVAFTWAKEANEGDSSFRIYIQSLDEEAAAPRLLTRQENLGGPHLAETHFKFSPDGKWIVYAGSQSGMNDDWIHSGRFPQPWGEIYIAPVDGHCEPIRLTNDKWEDGMPFWYSLEN